MELPNKRLLLLLQDKGSCFVVISREYENKMLALLNNNLHYDKVDSDPTSKHLERVQIWSPKWLSDGQISVEIDTWVTNLEPKPGVAFGNVKTNKEGNPLRPITYMWNSN